MFDDSIFGGLFDLDGDVKLDFFEQGLEFMAISRNNFKSLDFSMHICYNMFVDKELLSGQLELERQNQSTMFIKYYLE